MRESSITSEVLARMQAAPRCTIFTVDDLVDLADEVTLRSSLFRLVEDQEIARCIKGYFTIPYQMELVNQLAMPSTHDLAEKIAERYGWTILPINEAVLNYLGLSTQVPVELEYISTGPYREVEYRGHTIKFKHTDQLTLLQLPKPNALVIQAIKAIGKDKLTQKDFDRLCVYYRSHGKEKLSQQPIKIPTWIRRILRKIEDENNGKIYQSKPSRTSLSFSGGC